MFLWTPETPLLENETLKTTKLPRYLVEYSRRGGGNNGITVTLSNN